MPANTPKLLKKATALLLIAVVLLLGWAGASPGLHAHLHGQAKAECESPCEDSEEMPAPHSDHYCAVHLFQVGATWCVAPPLPEPAVLQIGYLAESSMAAPKALCPLPGNRGPPIVGFAS